MSKFKVVIYELNNPASIVHEIPCTSEYDAEKVARGASINLAHNLGVSVEEEEEDEGIPS